MAELMDQAQHFGGAADAGSTGSGGENFREGLDVTERECMFFAIRFRWVSQRYSVLVGAGECATNEKLVYQYG